MLKSAETPPNRPGIYVFWLRKTPLYIGKAANLKQRLASYFTNAERLTPKVKRMLQEATRLETIQTPSEVEALIKEAELIKKYRPKYNILMRDDKNYFYVGVTKEEFPRIFITHQPHQNQISKSKKQKHKSKIKNYPARCLGPYTSGTALKTALKLLRRVFPYCTCKRPHKRPCLNSEIGRCLGYCCAIAESKNQKAKSKNARREYKKNIRNIVAVLEGRKTRLVSKLKSKMREAVKKERYEAAARLRDAIFGLEDVFTHRQVLHAPGSTELTTGEARYSWVAIEPALKALLGTDRAIERIEGYDISNISGAEATGSMVVFLSGHPDKSQYRKFRIKTVKAVSDVDMLKEVLRRRLNHSEWLYPDLMVIDGGKPQLGAGLQALREFRMQNLKFIIPMVTALAKREEKLCVGGRKNPIRLRNQDPALLHLFQRIRDESHRFARAYHHKLRKKYFADARIKKGRRIKISVS